MFVFVHAQSKKTVHAGGGAQWNIWLKICSDLKKISSFILVARIDPWNTLIPNLVLFYLFEA